jgi:hypothetical protein
MYGKERIKRLTRSEILDRNSEVYRRLRLDSELFSYFDKGHNLEDVLQMVKDSYNRWLEERGIKKK